MRFMFEVYYASPESIVRELEIGKLVESYGGKITFREGPNDEPPSRYICLTIEFDNRDRAEEAAKKLRDRGEYIEGIQNYGDD